MALQIASHVPTQLQGGLGKCSGKGLLALEWWTRPKYHACLGNWRDYNCWANLALCVFWYIRRVMLAAILHKLSNLSDLAQWKFTFNFYKLNMDIPGRACLSPKYRLRGSNLPCFNAGLQCTNASCHWVGKFPCETGKRYTISILTYILWTSHGTIVKLQGRLTKVTEFYDRR